MRYEDCIKYKIFKIYGNDCIKYKIFKIYGNFKYMRYLNINFI